jgi:hypothetical protein
LACLVSSQSESDSKQINPPECGKSSSSTNEEEQQRRRRRFASGDVSERGLWGWHVMMSDQRGSFFYSGTLINSQWVVRTATFSKYVNQF